MVYAEETVVIERPASAVFDVLTDVDRMPSWRANVLEVAWLNDGAPAVGAAAMRAVTTLLGVRLEWTCDVTAWDPPTRFAYVARSGSQVVDVEFRCQPADGGTRVTMAGGGDVPGGRIGAVAAPLYIKALLRENRKGLRRLKAVVEGR